MRNLIIIASTLILASCSSQTTVKSSSTQEDTNTHSKKIDSSNLVTEPPAATPSGPGADPATIMARKQVPVLCYHHIKDIDVLPKNSAGYTVTVNQFKAQMKTLADSGFHTISP